MARSRKRIKVACGSGNNWVEAPCASVSSYLNRDHCSSSSIVEEQSQPYACVPSCSDQKINNIAELEAPCNVSCYNLETNTVAEQPPESATLLNLEGPCDISCYNLEANTIAKQPSYACALSYSDQEINKTAVLECPCHFSYYHLETKIVEEQSHPYVCAPCSDHEINTTAELEGPCNFSCLNLKTNTAAEQPYSFPWFSKQESCTVEEQPPSAYALSYYDVEESNTNNTLVEELLQSSPRASGAFPWSSNLLGEQQLSASCVQQERIAGEGFVVSEYFTVVGELWS